MGKLTSLPRHLGHPQNLIDEAKRHGAVDNVTCLLVQFLEAEAQEEPEALDGAAA